MSDEAVMFWGRSANWWDSAMLLSLGAAAICAAVVAVCTVGSIKANKREARAAEQREEQYKTKADQAVADATRLASEANAQAATTKLKTAEALERAAVAEAAAAESKLEFAKYRAPRRLSAQLGADLRRNLGPFRGQRYTTAVAAGDEPRALVLSLIGALDSCGWLRELKGVKSDLVVNTAVGQIPQITSSGLMVGVSRTADASTRSRQILLTDLLKQHGIEAAQVTLTDVDDDATLIIVAVGTRH